MPDTFFLHPLQAAIREFLWSEPFMQSFGIVTEDKEDVLNQLEFALAGTLESPTGKIGCSIIIHTGVGKGMIQNIPGFYGIGVDVTFIIVEQPTLNRDQVANPNATGYSALQVAEYLGALMKQYKSTEAPTNFYEDETPMQPPVMDKESGLIAHTLLMHCHGGITVDTAVVPAPTFTFDGGGDRDLQIDCALAGASIYYTTDGRAPRYFGEGNAANVGELYTGTFNASAFETVRARAYFPGRRASTVSAQDTRVALQTENAADALSETGQPLQSE